MEEHFQPCWIYCCYGKIYGSNGCPLSCVHPPPLTFPNTLIISVNLPLAVTRSWTVTNDTPSQSNTYHRAGNTQARKWLTWNGNVSHSVGARSWSEILAVGEMAHDKRNPVWAGIVEVRVPLHFFIRGGRYKDPFLTLRKVHTSPLSFPLFLLTILFILYC